MKKPDQFEYVNNAYGLTLKKHVAVQHKNGQRGQVVKAKGPYIYIQWDGASEPYGPYHPTSDLTYTK